MSEQLIKKMSVGSQNRFLAKKCFASVCIKNLAKNTSIQLIES